MNFRGQVALATIALTGLSTGCVALAVHTSGGAVSQTTRLWACERPNGSVYGIHSYTPNCSSQDQIVSWAVQGVTPTTQPTTTAAPTTTTKPPGSTIVPAGGACPRSTSSSTYEGNRLTQAQAAQALYTAGFRDLNTIRAFVGIGAAESSLCVRVWHWHPEFGAGQADVGWLQISTHFWPQFPQSQTLDPVGAARAALNIVSRPGEGLDTWDTWPSPASSLQPTAASVCAAVPATGC